MTYYYFSLGCAGIVTYVIYRFLASPLGYYLKALADNEIRIEYSGESVQRVIYYTYVLSEPWGASQGCWWPLPSGTSCQNTPSGFNLENLSLLRCSALGEQYQGHLCHCL